MIISEPTPYTANHPEMKNEAVIVIFSEPTPYTASLPELKNEAVREVSIGVVVRGLGR